MSMPGMVHLIKEIMAVDFAVYDISLFLNTHPNDRRALDMHNNLAKKSKQLRAAYQEKYGPLSLRKIANCPYDYINNPWPWEIRY